MPGACTGVVASSGSNATCSPVCANGGTCVQNTTSSTTYCLCPSQYQGPTCSLIAQGKIWPFYIPPKLSSAPCMPTGAKPHVILTLHPTFTGTVASSGSSNTSTCSPACQNGGTCTSNSTSGTTYCLCPSQYQGPQCSLVAQGLRPLLLPHTKLKTELRASFSSRPPEQVENRAKGHRGAC